MFLIVTRQVHDISRKLFVFQPVSVGDDEVIAAVNTRFFMNYLSSPMGTIHLSFAMVAFFASDFFFHFICFKIGHQNSFSSSFRYHLKSNTTLLCSWKKPVDQFKWNHRKKSEITKTLCSFERLRCELIERMPSSSCRNEFYAMKNRVTSEWN